MKWFDKCKEYTSDMYPSLKFLYVILFILVSAIGWSVFDKNLVSNDNMVVLRAAFSSILGYMLEASTSKIVCEDKCVKMKCRIVGGVAVWCCIVILIAHTIDLTTDNSSLILIKNTLLAAIGFLISSAKACSKVNKKYEETKIDNSIDKSVEIMKTIEDKDKVKDNKED